MGESLRAVTFVLGRALSVGNKERQCALVKARKREKGRRTVFCNGAGVTGRPRPLPLVVVVPRQRSFPPSSSPTYDEIGLWREGNIGFWRKTSKGGRRSSGGS
jgi:hypothetical protein